jgi:hypothetical protein
MATAKLTLPNGTVVNIEGTAEEVAKLLEKFPGGGGGPSPSAPVPSKPAKKPSPAAGTTKKANNRIGPQDLIAQLAEQGFFKSKRSLGEVQSKLEEGGHIYAITSLSTPILRLTRKRTLRRIKEKEGWAYVS